MDPDTFRAIRSVRSDTGHFRGDRRRQAAEQSITRHKIEHDEVYWRLVAERKGAVRYRTGGGTDLGVDVDQSEAPWVGQATFPITKRPRDADRTSFLEKQRWQVKLLTRRGGRRRGQKAP